MYFSEAFAPLTQQNHHYGPEKQVLERRLRYLRLFALYALHVFVREQLKVAIAKTHNGGKYNTKVVRKPLGHGSHFYWNGMYFISKPFVFCWS